MHPRIAGSGATLLAVLLLAGCQAGDAERPGSGAGSNEAPIDLSTLPEPTPTSYVRSQCPRLGIYGGWDQDRDVDNLEWFGALPEIATSYYQPDQRINVERETARILRGTSPNITFTTQGTDLIEIIAGGPSHPRWDEAGPWLEQHLADLSTLADVDPSVPVYATMEHEFRPKVRLGMVTGRSADPLVYGRALDRFYRLAKELNPRLRTTYWIVGYNREFEGLIGEQFRTPPDTIVFDPYPHAGDETLSGIALDDVVWIRSQDWYDGQEIGIGEFAMHAEWGDASIARFLTDIRPQLADLGVAWAVFFNSERFDTRIVGRADGREFPRAQAAFSASLKAARDC